MLLGPSLDLFLNKTKWIPVHTLYSASGGNMPTLQIKRNQILWIAATPYGLLANLGDRKDRRVEGGCLEARGVVVVPDFNARATKPPFALLNRVACLGGQQPKPRDGFCARQRHVVPDRRPVYFGIEELGGDTRVVALVCHQRHPV